MLGTTGIQIHRQPVFHFSAIERGTPGLGTRVPQKIPGRTHESIHSVSLSSSRSGALGTSGIDEALAVSKGGFTGWFKLCIGRKQHRQIPLGYRDYATFVAVDHGDG